MGSRLEVLETGIPYNHKIKGHKKCFKCGESPKKFPNEASRREYQEITGICACCWEIFILETDAIEDDIEHAKKVLNFYGRKFYMQKTLPHSWQCIKCEKYVEGEQLLKPHICEGICKKYDKKCDKRCNKCKLVYYCDTNCQKEDWKRHRREDCL
jgi:hypothetical protein